MKFRNPFRKRKRAEFQGNPFLSKRRLAQFLGNLAAATFNGQISEGEARAMERIVVDFFKLLDVKDFSFELGDAIEPQPDRKLPYAT
jgi:hypothetical protein